MFHSFTLLLFAVAALTVVSYSSGPVPSKTPSTCFTCPTEDNMGFPLVNKDEKSDPLFCSYPSAPNGDPLKSSCNYSQSDGHLVQDNDSELCPAQAINCADSTKRKHQALPKSPRTSEPKARGPKPHVMQTRSKLGKMKRRARV